MEGRNAAVARNPLGDGSTRHDEAMFRGDASRRLFLGVTQVVNAEGSGDHSGWILDAFESSQKRKVPSTVLAPIDLNLTTAVLTHAVFDDSSSITDRAAIGLGLDRRTESRKSGWPTRHSGSLPQRLRSRKPRVPRTHATGSARRNVPSSAGFRGKIWVKLPRRPLATRASRTAKL